MQENVWIWFASLASKASKQGRKEGMDVCLNIRRVPKYSPCAHVKTYIHTFVGGVRLLLLLLFLLLLSKRQLLGKQR